MKKITLLVTLFTFTNLLQAQEYSTDNVVIKQGNQIFNVYDTDQTITLQPETFSIQYLNKPYQEKKNLFYAARALVTDHKIDIELEGQSLEEIPYFEPGTGFAIENNLKENYPMLSDEGHQYLYYVSNKDKRVENIGKSGEWDIYEWTLGGIYQYDAEMDWRGYDSDEVNILFIVDRNLNGIIEQGEHHNLQILFKK